MEARYLYRVSVDIGGTFTDLVALEEKTGELLNIKVSSVPKNPELGVVEAFKQFLREKVPESVGMVTHATTIATNALFGQVDLDLPKTAMITTSGFKDVVEIGRQRRADVYNLFFQRPRMLAERRLRYTINERIDSKGNILTPLDMAEVDNVLDEVKRQSVETLAICFLNSYVNPVHEKTLLAIVKRRIPRLYITTSSGVSNEYREYERFSTAVVNATLMPIIRSYLEELKTDIEGFGIKAPILVMQSNGGMATTEIAAEKPAAIVESGPASGVIAASWLGGLTGERNIISFDMGGTTAKAGTIRGVVPEVIPEYEVAGKIHMGRLVKGSGYPVRFPFIDLAECSAGGGTIAWIDEGNALRVGPTSAGAKPGPACYGGGGEEPTIADANLVLGRLNPQRLLGGEMLVFPRQSRLAFRRLGKVLSCGVEEIAVSVVKIANSMMSQILRIVSVERGFDPRNFTMVAFGGAGPMHVCALAEGLGIGRIIIPPNPGMFSAMGLLTADILYDQVRALVNRIDLIDPGAVESCFQEMEKEGRIVLSAEDVAQEDMSFHRVLDLRYLGQSYELPVEAPNSLDEDGLATAVEHFNRRHLEVYGFFVDGEPVELVNARLRAVGKVPKPKPRVLTHSPVEVSPLGWRLAYFEMDDAWIDTPIYERKALGAGATLAGPCIVEQYDSTTVIYPDWIATVDKIGNLVMRKGES